MNDGWVKLHRQLLDSRVFANEALLKVWIYCLCRANHKSVFVPITTGRGQTDIEVNPGQFIYGRKTTATDLNMKESSVHKRFKKLQDMGNITMQSNTHYSIVTICNWDDYQGKEKDKEQAKEQPSDNQVTGKEQPSNTDKNDKKEENDKKILKDSKPPLTFPWEDIKVSQAWDNWKSYKKKEYRFSYKSGKSESMALSKLEKLSGGDPSKAIEIINESIANGWSGLYELKSKTKSDYQGLNGSGNTTDAPTQPRKIQQA